jgi:hypothetical protein
MPVAQSLAHYINSSKGCPSITESFPLCCLLLHKLLLSPLSRHCQWRFAIRRSRTFIYFVKLKNMDFVARMSFPVRPE